MAVANLEGRRIRIQGTVQGVGFRPWVYRTAHLAGVSGRVRNDSAGVTIEAFGDEDALNGFVDALQFPPPAARILALDQTAIDPEIIDGFEIVESDRAAERRVSIPPDLATCDDCVREIFDPANRRYRYPFTNCTNCGPQTGHALGCAWNRRSPTSSYSFWHAGHIVKGAIVVARRSYGMSNAIVNRGPQFVQLVKG